MAQTDEFLDEGIAEMIDSLQAAATNIVCMTDSTPCTAAKTNTHASPADTLVTDSGLADQAVDTVSETTTNTTGDTITWDHEFTATGTKNVSGIHITNSTPDASYVEVCFNAILAMENTDTLTIDGEAVIDQAA
jgi:hypothetical protein